MLNFWTKHAPRTLEMLVVSPDPRLGDYVSSQLGEDCHVLNLTDPYTALAILASRSIHGAVFDADLPQRMASGLARGFLQHQPVGHVVIVAAADDMTSVIGLAYGDKRVELLFRPLDGVVLRGCLLGTTVSATTG